MEDTALLTDDEIVALCVADGRPWPVGLPTVETTSQALAQAGMRGMRSLMVRRLAGADADRAGVRPHEMIARDVAAFLDAPMRISAHLAPADNPSVLGGASVTAAQSPPGWVVDSATAAGVHALRGASSEEAAAMIVELADRTHSGEFFDSSEESSGWTCVVQLGSGPQNRIVVGPGTVSGSVDGAEVRQWDPRIVHAAFGVRG
jgi:hypothetical protein